MKLRRKNFNIGYKQLIHPYTIYLPVLYSHSKRYDQLDQNRREFYAYLSYASI